MNSSDLFILAAAGAQTESSMSILQNQLRANTSIGNVSSWLADKTKQVKSNFDSFVNSRLWEYSARLLGEGAGEYVGRFDIGYLGTLDGLQGAEGLMRNYIMANPNAMRLYEDGIIEGYGGELNPLCKGIGDANYFFRQANNGVTRKDTVDEDLRWMRSNYHDTIGEALSFRDRVNIHKTWNATNAHIADSFFDFSSPISNYRKDYEPETKEM